MVSLPESLKEETKLTAAFLNAVALAMLSLGFVVPLVADLYGAVASPPMSEVITWGPLWLLGSIAMHYTAIGVLKDLDR